MLPKVINDKVIDIAIYDPPELQDHAVIDPDMLYQILLNNANRPGVWVN